MARTVPIDGLADAVRDILDDYGDGVQDNLNEITAAVTKKGASTLRSQASGAVGGAGKYAKGWTSQTKTGRISAQGTIYNKAVPGLPHLLENGHANRGGGRTPGRVHIKPVEETLVKEFEQKVKSKL